ncbi:steryl acetyl hydrolase [Caenibius tardaugens NBRC 16725]|nr:steryl acetyl hydrolase [Caenibius tardaugens NBRC 16725]
MISKRASWPVAFLFSEAGMAAQADRADWQLPPLREGYAADADLLERRIRAGGALSAPEYEQAIGGVRCLVVSPPGAIRTMLYFHGGGYRMGSPVAWLPYVTRLAEAAGANVILPYYRLAPENPFPAALHDAVAVYRALAERGDVVLAGDSAGGGLALALGIVASQAGRAAAGVVLVSPMLDFAASADTYESRAGRDLLFSRQAVADCGALYLQGHPVDDPLVSGIHADPESVPPALVLVGGEEVLLGEALHFVERLGRADRAVTLHVAPGMGHVWPMMAPDTVEADNALGVIAAFVKSVWR